MLRADKCVCNFVPNGVFDLFPTDVVEVLRKRNYLRPVLADSKPRLRTIPPKRPTLRSKAVLF
jgi:hypothetical protein